MIGRRKWCWCMTGHRVATRGLGWRPTDCFDARLCLTLAQMAAFFPMGRTGTARLKVTTAPLHAGSSHEECAPRWIWNGCQPGLRNKLEAQEQPADIVKTPQVCAAAV
mmetsp:Transcript_63234/g.102447  ORF Transcript_63234/g.102447 Transcript_63234/m.102447 type:complete len:108 (+) Transcript_63234:125-448(+)